MGIQERVRAAARALRGDTVGRKTEMQAGVPQVIQRIGQRAEGLPKATPANLRKMAETPVARKAINMIKDRVACMGWEVRAISNEQSAMSEELSDSSFHLEGRAAADFADGADGADKASASLWNEDRVPAGAPALQERIGIAKRMFAMPNPGDSFRTMVEQVLEDVLVGGFGALELAETGDAACPLRLWPVDGATIRVKPDWDGEAKSIRYAQETGRYGKDATVELRDEDLVYVRSNPRTHTPFGLGRMEVAFEAVNALLGANRYAGKLASNSVVQYALWIEKATPQQQERLIRWWQDEIEGTGKVPLLSCDSKPEVLQFHGGTDAELRLQWQEFLIRIIANAFDLPPMMLGIERDVNRNTATEMADEAFRTAIRPTALLVAEHFTRDILWKKLGWTDLQFEFTDLEARDEGEELDIQLRLLAAGVVSVEEVRKWRGLGEQKAAADFADLRG